MKFYQFFANVDAASFGVNDEDRIEIIQDFLTSDYEEEVAIINFLFFSKISPWKLMMATSSS